MKLEVIKNAVTSAAGRVGLKAAKHSPEILLATGVAAIVGGTVLACKATLKVDEIIDERAEKLEEINQVRCDAMEDETIDYTEEDHKRDTAIVKIQTIGKLVLHYVPAVTLIAGGIVCIMASHGIMKKRNVALMAACKAVQSQFEEYRKRVTEQVGPDVEKNIFEGAHSPTVGEVKDGAEKGVLVKDEHGLSPYAVLFDEGSEFWKENADYNYMFLRTQQNYLNDLLRARGHVFLNEVYDRLGLPRTSAGAIVGWIKDGQGIIDIGIHDFQREKVQDFVRGYERCIWLDFNVDGIIYDLI